MPLALGQLLSGNGDPNDPSKKNQASGLVGTAGGGALPGTPTEGGTGLDFAGFFPEIQRGAIQQAAPIRDTSGLMFNPEFAQRATGLDRQAADLGLVRNQNVQNVGQEYERSVGNANTMQQQARKKLMERMSGQGILQSGIHGQQQGELNTAHTKYLDDLAYMKAQGISNVESDYAQRMNNIALAREGLFGEQQRVEEERRLESARIAAQQQADADAATRQEQMLQQMRDQSAADNAALLASIQAQQYSAPSFGGGGYESYQAPTPQGPNWGAQAARFEDVLNWSNQMRHNYAGNRQGFDADVSRLLQQDPNWSGSMQNAMGSYYGGANNINEVLGWLWAPSAPRLQGPGYQSSEPGFW